MRASALAQGSGNVANVARVYPRTLVPSYLRTLVPCNRAKEQGKIKYTAPRSVEGWIYCGNSMRGILCLVNFRTSQLIMREVRHGKEFMRLVNLIAMLK